MAVSSSPARLFFGRLAMVASACFLASVCLPASAQAVHNYSSSASYKALYRGVDFDGSSLASAPTPNLNPEPQYGQTTGQTTTRYPSYQSKWSHLAFEVGGGFTTPIGNTGKYQTFGGNLRVGGGWNFNKWLGALAEFEFDSDKIPGKVLAGVGAPGGHVHTWSISVDPIIYYAHSSKFGGYLTGGGGFYHKATIFTTPVQSCSYYYGYYCGVQNVTIGQFSSGQGGLNIGTGGTWKAFGPDSRAKLYAEARYEWVDSPAATKTTPGTGTENLIPVTFGIRF